MTLEEQVWRELEKATFAVVSHVTSAGEPRSSGVMYGMHDRRLYMVVAPDGWKARCIRHGHEVAVTVPIRRGGILALVAPVPPATISFHARATVHEPGTLALSSVSKRLDSMLPQERRGTAAILELEPEGRFLTYGIGVPLMRMRDPSASLAHVPIA